MASLLHNCESQVHSRAVVAAPPGPYAPALFPVQGALEPLSVAIFFDQRPSDGSADSIPRSARCSSTKVDDSMLAPLFAQPVVSSQRLVDARQ